MNGDYVIMLAIAGAVAIVATALKGDDEDDEG